MFRVSTPFTSSGVVATLRNCVDSAQRLGRTHAWLPAAGSVSAAVWQAASTEWRTAEEALARTVAEADVHAITLVHSGLEHANLVARTVSRGLAYTPHTIARTTEEHLLRALHYQVTDRIAELGSKDDQLAIAEVRFNQVLSNLSESGRLTGGLAATEWAAFTNDDVVAEQWRETRSRIDALGWKIETRRGIGKLAHTAGRASTMELAAKYLADEDDSVVNGQAITQLIIRTRGSASHGYETGLLSSTRLEPLGDLPFAALTIEPRQMEVGELMFSLMTVPISVANAIDALAARFGWTQSVEFRRYETKKSRMLEAWIGAVNFPGM